jgi:secreted trypsin-like serine protease
MYTSNLIHAYWQGDSGGPLYVVENEKRAVLVGVVNRGEGCARKNAMGIYAFSVQFWRKVERKPRARTGVLVLL